MIVHSEVLEKFIKTSFSPRKANGPYLQQQVAGDQELNP